MNYANINKKLTLAFANSFPGSDDVCFAPEVFGKGTRNRRRFTSQASFRLQAIPLLDTAAKDNIDLKIYNPSNPRILESEIYSAHSLIIGKLSTHPLDTQGKQLTTTILQLLKTTKRLGKKICAVYSDNYLAKDSYQSELYQQILQYSSKIITPTSYLREVAKTYNANASCQVISDPCLLKPIDIKRSSDTLCRLIWFGQGENTKYLLESLEILLTNCAASKKYELTILTRKAYQENLISQKIKEITIRLKHKKLPSIWSFRLISWDDTNQPTQLQNELERAHISFIPSDKNSPWKKGASSNRLVDSLQVGCLCITSPLESYQDLYSISLQGQNFPELIDHAWANFEELSLNINDQKAKSLEHYSEENTHRRWRKVIDSLLK